MHNLSFLFILIINLTLIKDIASTDIPKVGIKSILSLLDPYVESDYVIDQSSIKRDLDFDKLSEDEKDIDRNKETISSESPQESGRLNVGEDVSQNTYHDEDSLSEVNDIHQNLTANNKTISQNYSQDMDLRKDNGRVGIHKNNTKKISQNLSQDEDSEVLPNAGDNDQPLVDVDKRIPLRNEGSKHSRRNNDRTKDQNVKRTSQKSSSNKGTNGLQSNKRRVQVRRFNNKPFRRNSNDNNSKGSRGDNNKDKYKTSVNIPVRQENSQNSHSNGFSSNKNRIQSLVADNKTPSQNNLKSIDSEGFKGNIDKRQSLVTHTKPNNQYNLQDIEANEDEDKVQKQENIINRNENIKNKKSEESKGEYISSYEDELNDKIVPSHFGMFDENILELLNKDFDVSELIEEYSDYDGKDSALKYKKESRSNIEDYPYNPNYDEVNQYMKQFHEQISHETHERDPSLEERVSIKDLFFRTYTKPVDGDQHEIMFNDNKEVINIDRRGTLKKEQNSGLFKTFYSRAQNFFCSVIPFFKNLICPNDYYDEADNLSSLMNPEVYTNSEIERKIEPSVLVTKECPVGTLIEELDHCLYFVLKEARFSETKSICSSLAEGGTIWNANMDAAKADSILKSNKIVTGQYTSWIDGVYFEDTLLGSGHFDSNYKNWINLGVVRGKTKNKLHILLNNIDGEAFYSYSEGRKQFPFICQCPPQEVQQYFWGDESILATDRRFHYSPYYGE